MEENNEHKEEIKETIEVETKPESLTKEKESTTGSDFGKKLEQKFGNRLPSFKFRLNLDIKTWPQKIMHTLREYKRVILVSRKPDIEELSEISKISGIGILIIGFIGFLLQTLFKLLV